MVNENSLVACDPPSKRTESKASSLQICVFTSLASTTCLIGRVDRSYDIMPVSGVNPVVNWYRELLESIFTDQRLVLFQFQHEKKLNYPASEDTRCFHKNMQVALLV